MNMELAWNDMRKRKCLENHVTVTPFVHHESHRYCCIVKLFKCIKLNMALREVALACHQGSSKVPEDEGVIFL